MLCKVDHDTQGIPALSGNKHMTGLLSSFFNRHIIPKY